MKTVKGYLVKRGGTYYAEWNIDGKRFRQSTKKTNKDDAKTELARIMAPFMTGNEKRILEALKGRLESVETEIQAFSDQKTPPTTFNQAWSAYLTATNRPDSGERTLSDYQGYFTSFWKWLQKTNKNDPALRDVTPAMAGEYASQLLKDKLSAGTYNKHLNALALVYRVLSEPARITTNPWESIRRKRAIPQSRRELTVDELRRLCSTATGELRVLLAVGLYTGLRLGDAATLRWGEVDLVRGIIRRIPNKTSRRNPKPVLIPIHPSLRAVLAEITDRKEYVTPSTAADYLRDTSAPSKRIQAHFTNCGVTLHKPGTGFELKPDDDGKLIRTGTGKRAVLEVGFHSLRHSFVSLCRESNAPLSVVESIVGHSSPAMTRHYTHTSEAAALSAVSSLPSIMTEEEPKALPPAPTPRMVDAEAVLAIFEGANSKNLKSKLAELQALAEKTTKSGPT